MKLPDNGTMVSDEPLYPKLRAVSILLRIYIPPFVIVIGCICNILTFIIMRRRRLRTSSTCFYMAVLAIADTSALIIGYLQFWIYQAFAWTPLLVSDFACKSSTFALITSSHYAVWLIVAMTIERFIAVSYPLKSMIFCTVRRAKIVCVMILLLCIIINSHYFFTNQLQQTVINLKTNESILDCGFKLKYKYFNQNIWVHIDAVIYSYAPWTIVVIFNLLIVSSLIRANRMQQGLINRQDDRRATASSLFEVNQIERPLINESKRMSLNDAITNRCSKSIQITLHSAPNSPEIDRQKNSIKINIVQQPYDKKKVTDPQTKEKQRLTAMLLIVSLSFIICTLPIVLGQISWKGEMQNAKSEFVQAIGTLFQYVNHSINFFLYAFIGIVFRQQLKILFKENIFYRCIQHTKHYIARSNGELIKQKSIKSRIRSSNNYQSHKLSNIPSNTSVPQINSKIATKYTKNNDENKPNENYKTDLPIADTTFTKRNIKAIGMENEINSKQKKLEADHLENDNLIEESSKTDHPESQRDLVREISKNDKLNVEKLEEEDGDARKKILEIENLQRDQIDEKNIERNNLEKEEFEKNIIWLKRFDEIHRTHSVPNFYSSYIEDDTLEINEIKETNHIETDRCKKTPDVTQSMFTDGMCRECYKKITKIPFDTNRLFYSDDLISYYSISHLNVTSSDTNRITTTINEYYDDTPPTSAVELKKRKRFFRRKAKPKQKMNYDINQQSINNCIFEQSLFNSISSTTVTSDVTEGEHATPKPISAYDNHPKLILNFQESYYDNNNFNINNKSNNNNNNNNNTSKTVTKNEADQTLPTSLVEEPNKSLSQSKLSIETSKNNENDEPLRNMLISAGKIMDQIRENSGTLV
ncbi:hypothetical protein SNEBB_001451 [Seison nebaliae]|nr:hypothetical protein SNEBB_001451 [Seison nebaliae]